MDFRKIFFVFTLLIFGSWGFGQLDSTDLNFYGVESDTSSDNIQPQLYVEFSLNDSISIASIKIEVVLIEFDSNSPVIFENEFTIDELYPFFIPEENHFKVEVGNRINDLNHQIFLTLVDANGHEIISISKFLVL